MLSQVKLKSFPWHGQYEGDRLGAIFGAAWELVLFLVLLLMFQIRFFIMVQSKLEIWYNFWWRCCFSKLGAFFYRGDQKCYLQLLADRGSITFLGNLYILTTANTLPISNPKRYTFLIFDLKDKTHEYMNIWPEKVNQPSMFCPLVQMIMPRSNPFRCCIVYLGTRFLGLFRTARLTSWSTKNFCSNLARSLVYLLQRQFWGKSYSKLGRWNLKLSIAHCQG